MTSTLLRRSAFTLAIYLILIAIPAFASQAFAAGPQGKGPGVGIILGEPSGLTGKYWLSVSNAVDLHVSFDFSDEAFVLLSNYLYHFDLARVGNSSVELPLYVGVGGKLLFDGDNKSGSANNNEDDVGLGVRAPFGLSILPTRTPLEFFVEIGLGLRIIPRTSADIDGGLGVRYYF